MTVFSRTERLTAEIITKETSPLAVPTSGRALKDIVVAVVVLGGCRDRELPIEAT